MSKIGKPRTLADALAQIRELKERAAVNLALVGVLRTRYLPRDGTAAQAHIACDGSPVTERMLDEMAAELEEAAKEMIDQAGKSLAEAV